MKKIFFLIIYFFFQAILFSQEIDITVDNIKIDRAYLSTLTGEKISQIDSITSFCGGMFQTTLDAKKYHQGFYRLSFDKNKWIDFVNDGEDVNISTDATNILGLQGIPVIDIAINSKGDVFAGTYGSGFFLSSDTGNNWIELNSGLTNKTVLTLAINSNSYLFAGTFGGGVFRSIESTTSVTENSGSSPRLFFLSQNYPNPFNPNTTISYALPMQSYVTLKVFDVLGREVATLVNGVEEPGYKSVMWDGANVTSGMYFYRLTVGRFTETKKLLLIK